MNFRKWLTEMTSTANIASYARPLFSSPIRRTYSDFIENKPKRKKRKKA